MASNSFEGISMKIYIVYESVSLLSKCFPVKQKEIVGIAFNEHDVMTIILNRKEEYEKIISKENMGALYRKDNEYSVFVTASNTASNLLNSELAGSYRWTVDIYDIGDNVGYIMVT